MKQRYYLYIFQLYKAKKENLTLILSFHCTIYYHDKCQTYFIYKAKKENLISSFHCTIYYHSYYYVIDVAYFKKLIFANL